MVAFNFHGGKLAVQQRAGTSAEAMRILSAGWIGTTISSSGDSQMADLDMKEVYLTSVDVEGQVWASVVMGDMPGFVTSLPAKSDRERAQLIIDSGNRDFLTYVGDPLVENTQWPNAPLGVLLMGYKNRHRYRIDGRVASTRSTSATADPAFPSSLTLDITMAMGNCPKYLHVRDLITEQQAPLRPAVKRSSTLSQAQMDWISISETFILGTFADGTNGGADASNRGGNPGFVQALDERTIVFPDYKGNNLYLSLGNIAANPKAGLLFINRSTGDVLQVSGAAHIVWEAREYGSTATGKHIRIEVTAVVEAKAANPLRMKMKELSPFNPPLPASIAERTARIQQASNRYNAEADLQQQQRHLVRCSEAVDAAKGVKSFRFESAGCCGGRDLPVWTPGQFATFYFPTGERATPRDGVSKCQGMFTLPKLSGGAGKSEIGESGKINEDIIRTWTITSIYGADSPLEITVQAKDGGVSEELHRNLKPGDLVRLTVGGDFTLTDRLGAPPDRESKILLLSAGIGVTPMAAAIRWLRQRETKRCLDSNRCLIPGHPDVVAVHTTRSTDVVPFLSELNQVATRITASASNASPSSRQTRRTTSTPTFATNTDDTHPTNEEQRVQFVLAITGSRDSGNSTPGDDAEVTDVAATEKNQADPAEVLLMSGTKRGVSDDASGPGFSVVNGRPDAAMLKREVPDIADRSVLMCGPEAFMVAMEGVLKGLGVASSAIHQEEFCF